MTTGQILLSAASIIGGVLGGVVAAAITVRYHVRRDRRTHEERTNARITEATKAITDRMDKDMTTIHEKVSALRDQQVRELLDRTARIEGQLVGISRTLHIIQERYMGAEK